MANLGERDLQSLQDLQDSAQLILNYASGFTEATLAQNKMVQDAIIRRFEIIGEASARISDPFKAIYPAIPWQVMKSMRNLLIHQYDSVDIPILWKTLEKDIPALIKQVSVILRDLENPDLNSDP